MVGERRNTIVCVFLTCHLRSTNSPLRKHKHVTYDSQLYYAMMKTEKEVITETEKKGNNEEKR